MRGRALVALGAAAASLAVAVPALAEEEIRARPNNTYENPNVTIDQGERLTFRNLDVASHDVTAKRSGSDGRPLFASETIGTNRSSFVEGSQYLTTGAYGFLCSIHPSMEGTLTVNSMGMPAQRPVPPPPDTKAPSFDVLLKRTTLRKAARSGRLPAQAILDESATLSLRATARRRGKTVKVASGRFELGSAGTHTISLKVTRTGRATFRKARRLAVTLTGSAQDAAGNATPASARRTYRR